MTTRRSGPPADILIVEDSPSQAQRLQHILEQQGYHVTHAADGRQALDAAQQRKPALIISDVIMPEMDGYELCRHLKADASLSEIPVILVTTLSDPGDVIRGLECRADNFILKPYDERYLVSHVQFVLLNREMRQTERSGLAVEVFFNGQRHTITADRLQILNLLLSTYDAAIQRNRELTRAQEDTRSAERFLNSIVENVPSSIFVKDARELRYVRLNRAFEDLVGRPRSEILGKTDRDLFPAEEADFFAATDHEALECRTVTDIREACLHTALRGVRLLHTQKLSIVDRHGVPEYLLGISEDITERRASEQALAAATLEADRANRAKSAFLSRMSHELRTPLNAIMGFAQVLQLDSLTPEQSDGAKHILHGGRHLLALINEVMDVARIEAEVLSLSPEPVAVAEVVQRAADLIRPLAAQRDLTIHVAPMPDSYALADRQRLNQILFNLLSNAVKYNREGGTVRVFSLPTASERVRIVVADTGAGIPPDKLALLFTPFERLGAEQSGIEGTGLGLALARGLAEAMKGSLTVESVIDQGSSFCLELPASAAVAEAEAAVDLRLSPEPSSSGTILYIEDNVSNLTLMRQLLRRRPGVELLHACDGRTGMSLVQERRPGLVFLDLHLPDVSGDEVLRQIWENPATRGIPVVVLSADATPAQQRRLLASGAMMYLTKPFDISDLLRVIDRTLGTGQPGK